jgi:hypothetical protein
LELAVTTPINVPRSTVIRRAIFRANALRSATVGAVALLQIHPPIHTRFAFALAVTAASSVGCRAFDREQYRTLLANADVVVADADDAGGACLALRQADDAGCVRAVVPTPPAALANQPSNTRTYVLAARRIEVGPSSFGNWRQIGFDRDGICTEPDMTSPRSCISAQNVTDGDEGRDNAFGSSIGTGLHVMDTFRDGTVTETIGTGRATVGLRITEWGGGDDRSVTVEWLHLTEGRPASGTELSWTGTDRWKIEPTFSLGADRMTVLHRTTDAFVACGYMVARMAMRIPLVLFSGTEQRVMALRGAVVAGPLDPSTGGVADVAGFWLREDVVETIPWFGQCPPPFGPRDEYNDRLNAIQRSFDIRSDLVPNPAMPCDAGSIAMRFHWAPVQIDGVSSTALPTRSPCFADAGM